MYVWISTSMSIHAYTSVYVLSLPYNAKLIVCACLYRYG